MCFLPKIHYQIEKIPFTGSPIKICPNCNKVLGGSMLPQLCGKCKTLISIEKGYILLKKRIQIKRIESKASDFFYKNNYLEARKLFEKVLEFEEGNCLLWKNYGITLLNLNEIDKAEKWLNKAINENGLYSIKAKYEKAYIYLLKGEKKKCIKILEECFQTDICLIDKVLEDQRFTEIKEDTEFSLLVSPKLEYIINKYISLKLYREKTVVCVCDKIFLTCQKVVLNILVGDVNNYDFYSSIDQIIEHSETFSSQIIPFSISPEEEFWAHCSNLQAWVENNYNTHILTYEISFGILNELSKKGVKRAQIILKEEIIERLKNSPKDVKPSTLIYFLNEGFISLLSQEEIFFGLLDIDEASTMQKIANLMKHNYTLTIELMEAYKASYTTKDKLHVFIWDGHVEELEINLYKSNIKILNLISLLPHLNLLYIKSNFSENVEIKLKELGFIKSFSPQIWVKRVS